MYVTFIVGACISVLAACLQTMRGASCSQFPVERCLSGHKILCLLKFWGGNRLLGAKCIPLTYDPPGALRISQMSAVLSRDGTVYAKHDCAARIHLPLSTTRFHSLCPSTKLPAQSALRRVHLIAAVRSLSVSSLTPPAGV